MIHFLKMARGKKKQVTKGNTKDPVAEEDDGSDLSSDDEPLISKGKGSRPRVTPGGPPETPGAPSDEGELDPPPGPPPNLMYGKKSTVPLRTHACTQPSTTAPPRAPDTVTHLPHPVPPPPPRGRLILCLLRLRLLRLRLLRLRL